MRTKLIKAVAYSLFSSLILVVVVLLLEIILRFVPSYNREWMDYNTNTVWRPKANNKAMHWTEQHYPFMQQFSKDGFNDINHSQEKKQGVKRIMVIGDSYTAGLDYPINETFCGILQQKLTERFPDKYEVMNCGVPAWGLEQEFLFFAREGVKYKPDYVLLVAAPNDIRETYTRHLLEVHDTVTETWLINPMTKKEKLIWKLSAHSSLAILLQKKGFLPRVTNDVMFWKYFGKSFPDFPSDSAWDLPLFAKQEYLQVANAQKRYVTILSSLNNQCKQIGASLSVSIIPTKEEFDVTLADTTKYQPGRVAFWLDTVCSKMNLPYYNSFSVAKQLPQPINLYQDWEFHLDPDGHAFMGEQLYRFFDERILKKEKPSN